MNEHPMKYVSMIKRLLATDLSAEYEVRLKIADHRLVAAAKEEARAYGDFKEILKELAATNDLAARFNHDTYLDLT